MCEYLDKQRFELEPHRDHTGKNVFALYRQLLEEVRLGSGLPQRNQTRYKRLQD